MGCFVDSWRYDYVQEGYCAAQDPALGNRVYFEVLGRSSQGYSYSWHTTSTSSPNVAFSVAYGCTSSSYYCAVDVRNKSGAECELTSSAVVTESATGASKKVTAVAWGPAACGSYFC